MNYGKRNDEKDRYKKERFQRLRFLEAKRFFRCGFSVFQAQRPFQEEDG